MTTAGESPTDARDASQLGFEQALDELEGIIDRIEQGEVGLEESLVQYRRGAALVRRCRSILDVAEQEVQRITADELDASAPEDLGDEQT